MQSVTSNAVYNALTLKNPTIVGQINSGDANILYFRIKDFVSNQNNQQNVLYVLQSRGGEIVIVNVGQDDNTYRVKAKRLLNAYTKIKGLSYSGNDLYIQIDGFSNMTTITKLCGNYDAIPTILIATETEYNSATSITIEE